MINDTGTGFLLLSKVNELGGVYPVRSLHIILVLSVCHSITLKFNTQMQKAFNMIKYTVTL